MYKLNSIGSCLTKSYRAFPYRSSVHISLRGREKGFCPKSVVLHHMQDNPKCWRRKLLLQVNILCLNICCVPPSATTVRVDNDNWVSYRQSRQRGSVCEHPHCEKSDVWYNGLSILLCKVLLKIFSSSAEKMNTWNL